MLSTNYISIKHIHDHDRTVKVTLENSSDDSLHTIQNHNSDNHKQTT